MGFFKLIECPVPYRGFWFGNPSSSVAAVEEECDTADDIAICSAVAGHLERAEELLAVQVEVEGRLDDALLGVGVGLIVLDPGQIGDRQLDDLRSFATDLVHLGAVEGAALQEETFDQYGPVGVDLALLEGRDQLELIDGHIVHSC